MMFRRRLRYIVTVVALAVAYAAAARLGLSLAFATEQVTAVWPASGIALAALLRLGYRAWPGVYIGASLVNWSVNEPLTTALGIAAGNTLEAFVGVFLLRRLVDFDGSLDKLRNVLGLIGLAAIASSTVGATIGVANLCLHGIVLWSAYASVWWVWWMGDVMGNLLMAPFILAWSSRAPWPWRGRRLVELGLLLSTLTITSYLVFVGSAGTRPHLHLEYTAFPFVMWAALRFGLRESVSLALLVSAVAIWGSVHDTGPFAAGSLDTRLIVLNSFMAVTVVTALLLSAFTAERQQAQARLNQSHAELEARVEERTAALARANAELRQVNAALTHRTTELARKNEEVEAFVYIVSHDLRAPLLNLQGFASELALSGEQLAGHLRGDAIPLEVESAVRPILDEEIPTALRYINTNAARFKRLIDALVELSRSGHHAYRLEKVDVESVVVLTLDALRKSIEASNAKITLTPLPPVMGDPSAIGQVFSNLIDNAIKYLKPGRPGIIEIGGTTEDGFSHYWVRDNGSGFPPAAESRLFRVFQRFHPTLASGEGIGLAMVKRIVERHGGKVWLESRSDLGAELHVVLPGQPHG